MELGRSKSLCSERCNDLNSTMRAGLTADAIEEHIAVKITEANAPLVAEIKNLNSQIVALRWLVGSFGLFIATVTAAGAIFN